MCVWGACWYTCFFHHSPVFLLPRSPFHLLPPRLRGPLGSVCRPAPPHHSPLRYPVSNFLYSVVNTRVKPFNRCPSPPVFLIAVGYIFSYSFSIISMGSWEEGKKNSCTLSAILNQKSKVLFTVLENWRQSKHPSIGKYFNGVTSMYGTLHSKNNEWALCVSI